MHDWLADIDAILFDWGGTLCDSGGEYAFFERCARAALAAGGATGLSLGDDRLGPFTDFFMAARIAAATDPEHRELDLPQLTSEWLASVGHTHAAFDAIVAMNDAFWGEWVGCLTPIGDTNGLLSRLKAAGYRIGLVSNTATPPQWCRAELERLGWTAHFDALTFSSEIGRRKPHAAMYDDALAKIADGRPADPSRVLFVGDTPPADIVGPKRKGMRTAHIRGEAADPLADVPADISVQQAVELEPLLIRD